MARIKYYYNTETCRYERVQTRTSDIIFNVLGILILCGFFGFISFAVYMRFFDSPKEARLKEELQEMAFYYQKLEKEVSSMDKKMVDLQQRDDNVYRTIFGVDPLPGETRQMGVGGVDRYKALKASRLSDKEMILSLSKSVDELKRKATVQHKSYDDIMKLAMNKDKMWASIPAIQPISNKELTRLSSGFGYRIHPIYKVKKLHTGIDFSAPTGTPIYATADGKVVKLRNAKTGYGKEIEIDHGYGFKTKYAHMNDFNVKRGQTVKRGECIGYVGSTGTSTAPHLHYEVMKQGKKINPMHYFFGDLNAEEYEKVVELATIENQSLGG
ncbi:M23 family metallopeptidase [Roseivirga sp. BDSF3-8]|uniref:M23 family metallopeptidase n=1 Tax=Roseivirga sp. BDSF3-8 TaxID=3241598 RepID=UPI0035323342